MDPMTNEFAEATVALKRQFPSAFMRLNSAQYRAFETMYSLVNGRVPDFVSVEFANGVGKSHMMIEDIIGVTTGTEFLNVEEFPPCAIDYYNSLARKRDSGKLVLRLTCTADDMKAGGSVYELMKQIFPWAKMTNADTSKVFRQIDIPHPTLQGITNHIAVKTFDQAEDKHSGSTCDRIWVNENLPEALFGETLARLRGGGSIGQFATILDYSSHIDELDESVSLIMRRCKGHIYENCRSEEVTDEMAAEVFDEIGIMLEKLKVGYDTRGVLSRQKIFALIEGWARSCPHQLTARKTGKPISSGGKLHESFNESVHVKSGFLREVPVGYPMVQVVDPHPARPDASIWAVVLPTNRLHVVEEWPPVEGFGYYEQIKDKRFTISQKCELWREIEKKYLNHIWRVGDPNRFREPNNNDFEQLSSDYEKHGFDFDLSVSDNFQLGIERVNEYLWFDANMLRFHPNDPAAQARLTIADTCMNTKRAMQNFARKVSRDRTAPVSEAVDEKYSCFAGCVRYLVMWHGENPFDKLMIEAQNKHSDMDLIRRGRVPSRFRQDRFEPNTHGRVLVR